MLPPEVRTLLQRCRRSLAHVAVPPELDGLAADLIDHLIQLHDSQRLTAPFLMLALESLNSIPALDSLVDPLMRFATHQAQVQGHETRQGSDAFCWVASSYADLEMTRPGPIVT